MSSTNVGSTSCDDGVSARRRCGERGGLSGATWDAPRTFSGSWTMTPPRYGRSEGSGLRGTSPVTVLDRVLVRARRERLTPLPMLELLATERIERGLCAGKASMGRRKEDNKRRCPMLALLGKQLLLPAMSYRTSPVPAAVAAAC